MSGSRQPTIDWDRLFMTRDEATSLIENAREFLVSTGVARHEKAMLRIEAVEDSYKQFKADLERVPTQLDREAARIENLFNQKLRTIESELSCQKEFSEAMRKEQEKMGSKLEASFTKEMDGLKMLLNASMETITSDVRNLTGRLDRGEGSYRGVRQEIDDRHAHITTTAQVVGQVFAFVVIMVMLGGLWINVHTSSSPTPTQAIASADTKRVDDLIAQVLEQNRVTNQRIDSLSSRLNTLTSPPLPSERKQ